MYMRRFAEKFSFSQVDLQRSFGDVFLICTGIAQETVLYYRVKEFFQEGCAVSQASVRNFQQKQVIFYEGDADRNLYKIISGRIALYVNFGMPSEKVIGITGAPNYLGTAAAFSGAPAAYTAVALEKVSVLQLPEGALENLPKSDPASAIALMQNMAAALETVNGKLRSILSELYEIGRTGGEQAVALNALADSYMTEIGGGVIIDEYIPYVKPAAKAPVATPAEETAAPAPVQNEPAVNYTLQGPQTFPEPYPEGHKGYPGIMHPEYEKYLIPDTYTCPHCQHKFTGNRIQMSKLVPIRNMAEEHRYDLRVTYSDFETEWHEIITCPHCYFSAFDTFFRESKSLYRSRYESKLAQMCDSIVIDFNAPRDLDAVFAQHYLALICAPGFTDHRQITARLWVNLWRLYQDAGEPQLVELAEKKSVESYEKVFMEVELNEGQEQRLCLTVAGILYARGEKRAAREWAARVRHGSGDRSAYWNMAEQLIQDVRAEMEEGLV